MVTTTYFTLFLYSCHTLLQTVHSLERVGSRLPSKTRVPFLMFFPSLFLSLLPVPLSCLYLLCVLLFFDCVSSGCLRVRFTVCPGVRVSLLLLCRAVDFSALPSRNLRGYLVVCCAALDL